MSTEIRGLQESELSTHAALVHQSYYEYVASGERVFLGDPDWWLKSIASDPYYRPEQTRVMIIDGQFVSSVTNYTRHVYADGRTAKVSCIGSVCTHPDFRRRGLVRQVLAEAIDWMQTEGYQWSCLFGLEDVYGSSGWSFLSSFNVVADLRLREDAGRRAQVRAAQPDSDAPILADLYEHFNRTLTGPVLRSEAYWRQWVLQGRFGQTPTYYLVEVEGRPVGYFSGEEAYVRELGWVDQPAELFAVILRRWAGTSVRFSCFTGDMVRYLREVTEVPSAVAQGEHQGGLTLPETYRGLWRYIGDETRGFPEITDTASLKRFLRDHEYNFWPADSF